MAQVPPGAPPAGFFLSLLTESFAVRAFLGSLLAVALAAIVVRRVQSPRARRLAVLAPVIAAGVAAVASMLEAEVYLPQLWVATTGGTSERVIELFGELRVISSERGVDALVILWVAVTGVLLARRAWGSLATHRLLRRSVRLAPDHPLHAVAHRLARTMGTPAVSLRLLPDCPGGALTARTRRPVIVVDPALLRALDEQEAEGLIAHEIAHVARRDALLATVVGLFADITFFLPTVHFVKRALRWEREESADQLASRHTRRPAALASSILKVWESAARGPAPVAACQAVASVAATWPRLPRRPALSDGAQAVAARVERLVSAQPWGSSRRQAAEVLVASVLVATAAAASLLLPQWIASHLDTYSVAFGYVPPPSEPVESPAFATFRALAPVREDPSVLHGFERQMAAPQRQERPAASDCPCIETQAQWLTGTPEKISADGPGMTWRRTAAPAWDIRPASGTVRARPLLTLDDDGPRVGFFVVQNQR